MTFGYHEKEVLHGINLEIREGTVNALVGPSGSGKSTIARLVASLWDVSGGSITLGGVDIRKLTQEDYHRYIAYVSQDNFLFDTTVMENIRMGKQNATDAEVMEAAKACGCHAFILGLENGYDTVVGGAGGHLSGGERQRIAIARAMLKNAPIIILDEATAFTDPENEAMIQSAVAKLTKGKTLIVIAHRLFYHHKQRPDLCGRGSEKFVPVERMRSCWHRMNCMPGCGVLISPFGTPWKEVRRNDPDIQTILCVQRKRKPAQIYPLHFPWSTESHL